MMALLTRLIVMATSLTTLFTGLLLLSVLVYVEQQGPAVHPDIFQVAVFLSFWSIGIGCFGLIRLVTGDE